MITVLYAFSTKIHVYENISSEFEGNILRNVFFALAIAIRTHVLFPACRFLKAFSVSLSNNINVCDRFSR